MTKRSEAIKRLKQSLSPEQIEDLQFVIRTAEVQGDYIFNGEDSVYTDDVNSTLMQLADEFRLSRTDILSMYEPLSYENIDQLIGKTLNHWKSGWQVVVETCYKETVQARVILWHLRDAVVTVTYQQLLEEYEVDGHPVGVLKTQSITLPPSPNPTTAACPNRDEHSYD